MSGRTGGKFENQRHSFRHRSLWKNLDKAPFSPSPIKGDLVKTSLSKDVAPSPRGTFSFHLKLLAESGGTSSGPHVIDYEPKKRCAVLPFDPHGQRKRMARNPIVMCGETLPHHSSFYEAANTNDQLHIRCCQ
jgi:hypothetical protein